MREFIGLPVLVLLSVCIAGCSKKSAPEPPVRPVRTQVIASGNSADDATYTAEIRSRYETDLSFQVSGKLVTRGVDVGAAVKKGQVLAQLDQTDQQLGVDAARGAVPAAQSDFDRASSEVGRFRDLLERGLTTRAQYESQQTAARAAEAKLQQATAELKLAQQRLGYTTLRANQEGVVTAVSVEAGQVVAAGQRAISIARSDELEAVFDVPDTRIDEIRTRSSAVIAPLQGTLTWAGRVREISPSADPVTRTYKVRTSIQDPPASLRMGMTVSVTLPTQGGDSTAISLPSTALFQKDGKPAVWIVTADNVVELRAVTVSRYDSDRVVIAAGIRAGERVVTAGVHRLTPGEKVKLLPEKAA